MSGDPAKGVQCGANPVLPPERVGCGNWIGLEPDVYRCVDCGAPFHRECLKKHCEDDLAKANATIAAMRGAECPRCAETLLSMERVRAGAKENERQANQSFVAQQREARARLACEQERDEVQRALAWALYIMEKYEGRLIQFGDSPHLVNSEVHVSAKAAARALAGAAGERAADARRCAGPEGT